MYASIRTLYLLDIISKQPLFLSKFYRRNWLHTNAYFVKIKNVVRSWANKIFVFERKFLQNWKNKEMWKNKEV